MRARLHRTLAVVRHAAAPEDDVAGRRPWPAVPARRRTHPPCRRGRSGRSCACAPPHRRAPWCPGSSALPAASIGRRHLADFANHRRRRSVRPPRPRRRWTWPARFRVRRCIAVWPGVVVRRRHGEDVHGDEAGLQKLLGGAQSAPRPDWRTPPPYSPRESDANGPCRRGCRDPCDATSGMWQSGRSRSSADSRTSARPVPRRRWPASCRSR